MIALKARRSYIQLCDCLLETKRSHVARSKSLFFKEMLQQTAKPYKGLHEDSHLQEIRLIKT